MPRHLALGNGTMLVNFDAELNMRDLYFPRVGEANHILGHRNARGVWVDGEFDWVHSASWVRSLAYEDETLVSNVSALHAGMGVRLEITDTVHHRENLFLKRINVTNLHDADREVRLFFTHDFCIDESDIGDTSLYDLATDSIMHYKRNVCFLISGLGPEEGIFQYATGTKRFGGNEGTWRDAEDGWLEGNPIAQGSVDSTISFRLYLDGGEAASLDYWIACGKDFEEARRLHRLVRREGVIKLMEETRIYWRAWLDKSPWDFKDLDEPVVQLFKRSLLIIRTQIDQDGAILAANDTDILRFNRDHYSYMWPRDGALVAYALDKAGYTELTREFFEFCRRGVSRGGYLWHKYHPDGSVGSSWHPWVCDQSPQLPIQEDETALVIWALWHHYSLTRSLEFAEAMYGQLIKPAGDFMCGYRDPVTGLPLESYDLWEERRGVFTFTASAVWAGLVAAARFARLFGDDRRARKYEKVAVEVRAGILNHLYDTAEERFVRGVSLVDGGVVPDLTLESSMYGLYGFGVLPADDPRLVRTFEAIRAGLWVPGSVGGLARYEGDYYFSRGLPGVPGNPWIICTLWLCEWMIGRAREMHELAEAKALLEWVVDRAYETGVLSEQLHPTTGEPLSVAPLTWSHSTFVSAVLKYVEAVDALEAKARLADAWDATTRST